MNTTLLIATLGALLVGAGVGYILRKVVLLSQKSTLELDLKEKRLAAKEERAELKEAAEREAAELKKQGREEIAAARKELAADKEAQKERALELSTKADKLAGQENKLKETRGGLEDKEAQLEEKLEKVAELDRDEARERLFSQLEKEHADDLEVRSKKLRRAGDEEIEERGKKLLAGVLQRLSRSVEPDILSTKVQLEDDDLKGKIIGKDGRNIRAFQQATGVELVIDDTPRVVTISSYDPIRRAVAKYALDDLLEDGRVQPARIERFVADAKEQVDEIIQTKGREAAAELDLLSLDDRVVTLVGRLYYRTSYGQNVLDHSVEAAHIAGMLAAELGLDVAVAKKGALLHDIGKAVDHEFDGSHVEIGIDILEKFAVDEDVIGAMRSHHGDYPHASLEAVVVEVADGVSGARPGARKQSLDAYVKRLEELENIASKFSGVVNSYAIEAGREVRVFVDAEKVNDHDARKIARGIAKKIEKTVSYPGEVKVHVIRETRLTHFAR